MLELILLGVILAFGFVGLFVGLFQAIGSLVGVFAGTAVAVQYYTSVASFISPLFGGNSVAASVASFLVIFLVISRTLGFVFHLVNKAFTIIPGVAIVNRLGGFFLGLVEGILAVGIILAVLDQLPISQETKDTLAASWIVSVLDTVGTWILSWFS